MSCGIYKITNKVNGKAYIGLSKNIEKRWEQHRQQCEWKSRKDKTLYKAFVKYGLENFTFEIIEECQSNKLNNNEIKYIEKYDSYNNGYNMTIGGEGVNGCNNGIKIKLDGIEYENIALLNSLSKKITGKSRLFDMMISGEYSIPYKYYLRGLNKVEEDVGFNFNMTGFICVSTGKYYKTISHIRKDYPSITKDIVTANCDNQTECALKTKSGREIKFMYAYKYSHLTLNEKVNLYNGNKKFINKFKIVCLNTGFCFTSQLRACDFYDVSNMRGITKSKKEKCSCGKLPNGEKLYWIDYDEYINNEEYDNEKLTYIVY